MNAINVIRSLGPIDLKNIRRESMLIWMLFIPVHTTIILRFLVPFIAARLQELIQFDLTAYYLVIVSYFYVLLVPAVFGVLVAFLLLDERDNNTMTALQVTPLPIRSYVVYRVALPILFSFGAIVLFLPLAGLGSLETSDLLVTALVAAPIAPLFGLFMASFSHNKVQAFALMKGVGIVLFSPIFAYFVSSRWELLFGVIPAYWPLKVYWLLESGAANVWAYVAIGLLYQAVLILLFQRRFYQVLHR